MQVIHNVDVEKKKTQSQGNLWCDVPHVTKASISLRNHTGFDSKHMYLCYISSPFFHDYCKNMI